MAPLAAPFTQGVDASLELKDISPDEFMRQQSDFLAAVASVSFVSHTKYQRYMYYLRKSYCS
jgi:hypothetical protein